MKAREIVMALDGGRWYGSYGTCLCPAHEDQNPSLSVSDGGTGQLLLYCFAGCDFRDILAALAARGLVSFQSNLSADATMIRRKVDRRKDVERYSRIAREFWDEAMPIRDTPAERYLRNRGIDTLPPAALRYHPGTWHAGKGTKIPAVTGGDDFAIHRTYLRPDGSGKADVNPPKAMLGPCRGGAVRFSAVEGRLLVAEGIETALSAGILLGKPSSVWAALSTSGITGLRLPARPGELTIAIDGDLAGRTAADALAQRAHADGWKVWTWTAREGWDWNDHLLQREEVAF